MGIAPETPEPPEGFKERKFIYVRCKAAGIEGRNGAAACGYVHADNG